MICPSSHVAKTDLWVCEIDCTDHQLYVIVTYEFLTTVYNKLYNIKKKLAFLAPENHFNNLIIN